MPRSSLLLTSTLTVSIFLSASYAKSQTPVEVAYVVTSSGIETYDVDPQTAVPTDEGLTIVVPSNPNVVPSANGRFLYVFGTDPSTGTEQLWVYATNALGVLESDAIQQLNTPYLSAFSIDPNGTLAYAVQSTQNSQGEPLVQIRLFAVDPATGRLTESSKVAARYPPNGVCTSALDGGSFSLFGFNPSGTKFYDSWYCEFHESGLVSYYARTVNQETGALGPDVEVFSWGISTGGGYDVVDFTPESLIDFHVPNDYQLGMNSVNVYRLSGGNAPIFSCDVSMLEACGYGTSIKVDPSGADIFIQIAPDTTQITRLELGAKKIVATAYYVPPVIAFSPDDKLVYTQNYGILSPNVLPIYTLDRATGAVTTTLYAQIYVQQQFFTLVPSVRQP